MSASKEPYGEMSLLDFQKYFPDEAHTAWEYVVCRLHAGRRANPAPDVTRPWDLSKPAGLFPMPIVAGSKSRRVSGTRLFSSEPYSFARSGSGAKIYLMGTTSKKGCRCAICRNTLGIKNYKTVWLMGHKIRQAMLQREGRYRA